MNLDFKKGIALIKLAYEKRNEQKAWEMWLVQYANMDQKTFIPFDKFYNPNPEPKEYKPKEDIIAKAEEIRLMKQGKHKGVKEV